MFCFGLSHLARAEVEDFLAEQLEDDHVVLTQRLVGLRRADDVGNETLPVLWPLPDNQAKLKTGNREQKSKLMLTS